MDLDILQGRTAPFFIGPLVEPGGATTDLSDTTLRFMVKSALTTADASALIDHYAVVDSEGAISAGTGFVVGGTHPTTGTVYSGASSGVITLVLTDEDTEDIDAGEYLWELVVMRDGDVGQLRSGTIVIGDTLIDNPETLP